MTTTIPRTRWVAFRPLRHRNFTLVFSAAAISNVGTWMETVAVGSLVADRTGQAGWTALVAAATFLPMGLMGPIGGALADRVDRRWFIFGTTMSQTVFAAALTVLSATGHASPGAIAAVVFCAGAMAGLSLAAYQAMLPDLVPREDLLGAVSLGQAQYNLGRIIGPALAGIAIYLGSYTTAFLINTISFAAMLVALVALRLPPTPRDQSGNSLWSSIREGASAARGEPGVATAILMISCVALTVAPFIALVPAMAEVRYDGDSSLTAIFVAAQGAGAVVGSLLLAGFAERYGRHRLLMGGLLVFPGVMLCYAAAPSPVWATIALVAVGGTYVSVLSGLGTVIQLRAPAQLRARMMSLYFLALGVLYPTGAAIQGPIADRIGLGQVTAAGALVLLVVVVFMRIRRPERLDSLDDLDRYPDPARVPAPSE